MHEQLIGSLSTPALAFGKLRGYGLYVTTSRILGVPWKMLNSDNFIGEVVGPAGAGGALGELSDEARMTPIGDLDEGSNLQVLREDLVSVNIARRRGALKRTFTWWGDLTIQTRSDSYGIRVIQPKEWQLEFLVGMFETFDPERLTSDLG